VTSPHRSWQAHDEHLRLGGRLVGLGFCLLLGRLVSLALGSLGSGAGGGLSLGIGGVGRGPEGEVVAEQLHDKRAVTVRLLGERVELGDGVVEGLLGQVAGAIRRVQNLVVED